MFENCCVYLLVSEMEWQTRLSHIIRQLSFAETKRLHSPAGLNKRRQGLLPFLVIHSDTDDEVIRRTIVAARTSRDDDVRFMPIVILASDRSEATVRRYLVMGCDDIVAYPTAGMLLGQRLKLQLGQVHTYFQTASYFGPDRRRGEKGVQHPDRRGGKEHFYRRIAIKRDVRAGVKIVASQTFEPKEGAA